MSPQLAKAKPCPVRDQLAERLLQASFLLTALENREAQRPKISLRTARSDWDSARLTYLTHLRKHGC